MIGDESRRPHGRLRRSVRKAGLSSPTDFLVFLRCSGITPRKAFPVAELARIPILLRPEFLRIPLREGSSEFANEWGQPVGILLRGLGLPLDVLGEVLGRAVAAGLVIL